MMSRNSIGNPRNGQLSCNAILVADIVASQCYNYPNIAVFVGDVERSKILTHTRMGSIYRGKVERLRSCRWFLAIEGRTIRVGASVTRWSCEL